MIKNYTSQWAIGKTLRNHLTAKKTTSHLWNPPHTHENYFTPMETKPPHTNEIHLIPIKSTSHQQKPPNINGNYLTPVKTISYQWLIRANP